MGTSSLSRSASKCSRRVPSEIRRLAKALGPDWVAYPVLEVPNGRIQTLASASGHRRTVVVYDRLGRPFRTEGRPQFGALIASLPDSRLVLGLRYCGITRRAGARLLVFFS